MAPILWSGACVLDQRKKSSLQSNTTPWPAKSSTHGSIANREIYTYNSEHNQNLGLAVGATVGVLVLLLLVSWVLYRHRQGTEVIRRALPARSARNIFNNSYHRPFTNSCQLPRFRRPMGLHYSSGLSSESSLSDDNVIDAHPPLDPISRSRLRGYHQNPNSFNYVWRTSNPYSRHYPSARHRRQAYRSYPQAPPRVYRGRSNTRNRLY
jgi:hypothetical protein